MGRAGGWTVQSVFGRDGRYVKGSRKNDSKSALSSRMTTIWIKVRAIVFLTIRVRGQVVGVVCT